MDFYSPAVFVSLFILILLDLSLAVESDRPVFWGPWSDWSSCSSPCGQGVRTKTRPCMEWSLTDSKQVNVWRCQGRGSRQELCVSTACDFMGDVKKGDKLKCWALNHLGRGSFQQWHQVNDGNPCQLMCRERRSGFRRVLQKMDDGTVCRKAGSCQAGKCRSNDPDACIDATGRQNRRDMCLVCGGRNASCVYLAGRFGHKAGLPDEQQMVIQVHVVIPRGSTHIHIDKIGDTPNTLVLEDSYGHSIVNGDDALSKDGVYEGEGSKWKYSNHVTNETLSARGPTIGDVTFKLSSDSFIQTGTYSFWASTRIHPHLAGRWRSYGSGHDVGRTSSEDASEGAGWNNVRPGHQDGDNPEEDGDDWDVVPGRSHRQLREGRADLDPTTPKVTPHPTTTTTSTTPMTTLLKTVTTTPKPTGQPGTETNGDNVGIGHKGNRKDTDVDATQGKTEDTDAKKPSTGNKKSKGLKKSTNKKRGKKSKRKKNSRKRKKSKRKKKKRNGSRRRPQDSPFVLKPSESCFPCPRTKARPRVFCSSDFVSKVYVNRKRIVAKETRYDVTILSSYRNDVKLMQREYIWSESVCRCPNMKAKRTYILMGRSKSKQRDARESRLVISKDSYVRGFSLGADTRMRHMADTIKC